MSIQSALTAPIAAYVSVQPVAADAYAMSGGRLGAAVGALVALAGVIVGGLALARPAGRLGIRSGRIGANVALVAGLTGATAGGLVIGTSDGGVGTGNGLAGGVVALLLGLTGAALGGLALARSRRAVPADRRR